MDAEDLVSVVCPRIGDLGWAFYFIPETLKVGRSLGLDGLRFYFLGRGGVLGEVEAPVVVSAFGYFAPSLVSKMWNSAREICPPRDAAQAYMTCCAELGRTQFEGGRRPGRILRSSRGGERCRRPCWPGTVFGDQGSAARRGPCRAGDAAHSGAA